jgi:hypothetical protein
LPFVSLKSSPTAATVIVNISKKMRDGYLEAICPTKNSINISVLATKMRDNYSKFIIFWLFNTGKCFRFFNYFRLSCISKIHDYNYISNVDYTDKPKVVNSPKTRYKN